MMMKKTVNRLLNWAAERSEVLAKSRDDVRDMLCKNSRLQYMVLELESDVRDYQREVAKFAERAAKVSVSDCDPKDPRRYRVCVDIDHAELSVLFDQGTRGRGMDMVAEWVGRQAAQALYECNIVRYVG